MWNSALRGKFNFHFQIILYYYWQNFYFGGETGHWAIILWDLDILFLFSEDLSLKSFGSSWGNSYILCLLLIITLRFTCGEKKGKRAKSLELLWPGLYVDDIIASDFSINTGSKDCNKFKGFADFCHIFNLTNLVNGTKYSRVEQVKFVEDSL